MPQIDEQSGQVVGTSILPAGLSRGEKALEAEELGPDMDPMSIIREFQGLKEDELAPMRELARPLGTPTPNKSADGLVERHMNRAIKKNAHWLIDKMMELADGIWYEQEYKTKGEVTSRKVYKLKPDLDAINSLLDRGFGKTVQRQVSLEKREVTVTRINLDV